MSEWWTYRLSDLLMFSARSYWRLIELTNRELWPAQLVAFAAGIAVLACISRPGRRQQRIACLLLGIGWASTGWAYHLQRYADINTGAPYFAAAFALQALLLWIAAGRPRAPAAVPVRRKLGLAIAAAGLMAYPLLALAGGHGWSRIEVAGIAPDPTAAATLGVLLALRAHWTLWPIPLAWCMVSAATLMELHVGHAWLPAGFALLALAAGLVASRNERALSSTADCLT